MFYVRTAISMFAALILLTACLLPKVFAILFLMGDTLRQAKQKPIWKKVLWLLFKTYVGLCTLLMTVYLAFIAWNILIEGPHDEKKSWLDNSYDYYMKHDYPKRGQGFSSVATYLASYASEASVSERDVVHYLGKPDHVYGDTNKGGFVYEYQPYDFSTNKFFVMCRFSDGKLNLVGFGDNSVSPTSNMVSSPVNARDTNQTRH